MDTLYIRSCLHNLSLAENNNASVTDIQTAYYKGLIVGIVSALIDYGLTFEQSIELVKVNLPGDSLPVNKILESWFEKHS